MKLTSMTFVLLVLLSVTSCMSVPASTEAPAPATPVPARTVSAEPGATAVPSESPAVHDVLGRIVEEPHGRSGKGTAEHGSSDLRSNADIPSSLKDAVGRAQRYMPATPGSRVPAVPRGAQPHPTYDMRSVCAAGQEIASKEVTDLCRSAYGR